MSSNSVQSFMIDICNGPPVENGLHNVCLALAISYLYLYRLIMSQSASNKLQISSNTGTKFFEISFFIWQYSHNL